MNNLKFVQVPMSALISLDDINLKIYGIIYTSCKLNNNKFYHSYQQFADELCVSIRNVKYSVKYLANNGYIGIERGRGFKKPNVYHIPNGAMDCTINSTDGSEINPLNTSNGATGCTINGAMDCTQKEYKKEDIVKRVKENIKEKRESNEMINGKLNRKDEVKEKQSNNNMDFKKTGMYMELNSHPAVQSKDWAKETKEEKTHSSSAGTTKVIQIGDTRYAVETANTDYSSIWDSFPGGTASRENKKVQRVTTTEDRKDNTLSNASLHNENEDNPNEDKPTTAGQNTNPKTDLNSPKVSGATETAHSEVLSMQVDNYPTHTKKTPQERNNEGNRDTHNPMDCGGMSIDDLEDIYNGGNPISKDRSQTTSKAKSNEGGGGRKFTPRKEWEIAMEEANHHIANSNPYHKLLITEEDLRIITEGTTDKYRVIETLKTIKKLLSNRLKYTRYNIWLNNALDTLEANEKVYSPKQYDYACEIHDDCVDLYNIIKTNNTD